MCVWVWEYIWRWHRGIIIVVNAMQCNVWCECMCQGGMGKSLETVCVWVIHSKDLAFVLWCYGPFKAFCWQRAYRRYRYIAWLIDDCCYIMVDFDSNGQRNVCLYSNASGTVHKFASFERQYELFLIIYLVSTTIDNLKCKSFI